MQKTKKQKRKQQKNPPTLLETQKWPFFKRKRSPPFPLLPYASTLHISNPTYPYSTSVHLTHNVNSTGSYVSRSSRCTTIFPPHMYLFSVLSCHHPPLQSYEAAPVSAPLILGQTPIWLIGSHWSAHIKHKHR